MLIKTILKPRAHMFLEGRVSVNGNLLGFYPMAFMGIVQHPWWGLCSWLDVLCLSTQPQEALSPANTEAWERRVAVEICSETYWLFPLWLCGNDCFCLPTITSHSPQALSKLHSPWALTPHQTASTFISCRDGWCPSQLWVPGSSQEYCQWSNAKNLYPYKSLGLL